MLVMIVVPALAQGDQRQPKIIAAFIPGIVALVTEDMRQRIDGRGSVKQNRGADDEAPNEKLQARDTERWRRMLQTEAAKIER